MLHSRRSRVAARHMAACFIGCFAVLGQGSRQLVTTSVCDGTSTGFALHSCAYGFTTVIEFTKAARHDRMLSHTTRLHNLHCFGLHSSTCNSFYFMNASRDIKSRWIPRVFLSRKVEYSSARIERKPRKGTVHSNSHYSMKSVLE